MTRACGVEVDGPLVPFVGGLGAALVAEGYSGQQAGLLIGLMAEVSRWLGVGGLGAGDLTGEAIDAFFAARMPSGSRCRTARSLRPVMAYLRSIGVAPAPAEVVVGRAGIEVELLGCYRRWCIAQRGLTAMTTDQYSRRVVRFLALWRPDGEVVVADLDGAAILATISAAARVMPTASLRCMVTAVRCFLRFLHATGRCSTSLVAAVPALKMWPRTALASTLPAGDARRLVAGCDASTARGRRDGAVVLVLLRLGLRASEVGRLTLDDIDWRAGEVLIRGKGGRLDRLPLPVEVGEAIAAYLREGRPSSSERSLFLTATAPIRPMSSDAVGTLVYRACARAGVARVGPHALRRALATETLRAGAPMAEVAQLLRHADQATSSIYAAADVAAVAGSALAGGAAMTVLSLHDRAEDYLGLRRSFGYHLKGHDGPLADFVAYLARAGLDTVTVAAALDWAVEADTTPLRHAQRLSIARGFATYLHALDPRCEVPPRGLLPGGRRRIPPHIYTAQEIAELMQQSRGLRPALRAATIETIIGLLVATGMRSGEVVRLDRGDVDLGAGRLRVIATKFDRSRELALHPTVVDALARYARLRERSWPRPVTVGFFVSSTGRRLSQSSLEQSFAELVRRAGLEPVVESRARRPRLHDARHYADCRVMRPA